MNNTLTDKTPRDLLRVIFRRWRLFLLASAILVVLILLASHLLPLEYTGTTVFERRVDPAAVELMKGKAESFESQKLTLQNELIGRRAVARVIEELRLVPPSQDSALGQGREYQMPRQNLEKRLTANLKIDWRISSDQVDTVSLSYTDPDPLMAAEVPNKLVQLYFDSVSEQIKERLKQSCDFLLQRVSESNKGLQESRDKRLKFQAQYTDKYPEPGSFQSRILQLTGEIQNLRPQLELAKQREAQLMVISQTPSSGPTSAPSNEIWGPNPQRKRLEDELAKAQDEIRDSLLLKGMKEKHPTVVKLRKKIEDLEASIEQTPAVGRMSQFQADSGPGGLQLAFEHAAVKAEIALVTNRLQKVQSELDLLQTHVAEYSKVAQEYADLVKVEGERQEEVKRWNARLGELQMQLGAEVAHRATHQKTIQPARRQYVPSTPKLWMVMAGALLGGLGAGGGLAFLAQIFDRSISTTEDAQEYFESPIFGVIGEIVTRSLQRKRALRRWIVTPAVSLLVAAVVALSAWVTVLRLQDQEKYQRLLYGPKAMMTHPAHEDGAVALASEDK